MNDIPDEIRKEAQLSDVPTEDLLGELDKRNNTQTGHTTATEYTKLISHYRDPKMDLLIDILMDVSHQLHTAIETAEERLETL